MGKAKIAAALLVAVSITLLLSGRRVLVWEKELQSRDWTSYSCTYFTGRGFKTTIYGMRDECPFLVKPED